MDHRFTVSNLEQRTKMSACALLGSASAGVTVMALNGLIRAVLPLAQDDG